MMFIKCSIIIMSQIVRSNLLLQKNVGGTYFFDSRDYVSLSMFLYMQFYQFQFKYFSFPVSASINMLIEHFLDIHNTFMLKLCMKLGSKIKTLHCKNHVNVVAFSQKPL
jgi:hypothetical protein